MLTQVGYVQKFDPVRHLLEQIPAENVNQSYFDTQVRDDADFSAVWFLCVGTSSLYRFILVFLVVFVKRNFRTLIGFSSPTKDIFS